MELALTPRVLAEVITKDEKVQLWGKGPLGTNSPKALFRAVFFLNGRNFCLRGGYTNTGV